jgi:hypothetical protein
MLQIILYNHLQARGRGTLYFIPTASSVEINTSQHMLNSVLFFTACDSMSLNYHGVSSQSLHCINF